MDCRLFGQCGGIRKGDLGTEVRAVDGRRISVAGRGELLVSIEDISMNLPVRLLHDLPVGMTVPGPRASRASGARREPMDQDRGSKMDSDEGCYYF